MRSTTRSATAIAPALMYTPSAPPLVACHAGAPEACESQSHREPDVQDVAVLDDVLLPLQAELPLVPGLRLAAEGDEVVVVHDLGADEAALEVGVDAPRCARRAISAADGPGAHLVLADREEGDEVEQVVGGADEARLRRFGEAERGEELRLLRGGELGDLRLDRCAEREHLRLALARRPLDRGGRQRRGGVLPDVHDDEQRPAREEGEVDELLLLRVAPAHATERLAFVELRVEALQLVKLARPLVPLLAEPIEPLLDERQVVQHELGVEVAQLAL